MTKKKKSTKHQTEEEERNPFAFLDRVEWVWTGHEWQIKDLGSWWWGNLTNRYYRFIHDIFYEVGDCNGRWCTIDHAEQMIFRCAKYPVFSVDPDPMFIRRWIDNWIELQYCRIWNHVFDTLRLQKRMDETDAKQRADTLASQFEALYEPSWPRLPQVMKSRRGSKRDKTMKSEKTEWKTHELDPELAADVKIVERGGDLELHGPHPSPLLSYECCYRVLDRGDPEPAQYDSSTRAGFYDGSRVVVLIAGNNPEDLGIAADIAFRELKRRRVYKRLQAAPPVSIEAEGYVANVAEVVARSPGQMFTIKSENKKPSLAEAAQLLGVQESDLNSSFGVCLIDPEQGLYTVLAVGSPETSGGEGPFSNPAIGTFGPEPDSAGNPRGDL